MKQGDILLKKWCFGIGRAKPRKMLAQTGEGETQTYVTYPKYRTIAMQVSSVERKKNQLVVKGTQYATLTGDPKEVTQTFDEHRIGDYVCYKVGGQARPFHLIPAELAEGIVSDKEVPPVGSLVKVNKKQAIVIASDRNQLTVFVDGKRETVAYKPGSIKWHSDKLLKRMAKGE